MDSPNISIRIRRHESLPCHGLPRTHNIMHSSSAKASSGQQRSNRMCAKASVLIGRRLGATKNNPYVGSFRHAPPTSLRSMAASSLPSLSSRKEVAASSSSVFLSPSFAFAENSPYVGWFRHAPPVFSPYQYLGSSASGMKSKNNKTNSNKRAAGTTTPPRNKSSIVQHKVNLDSLLELDRWHQQLTSLLVGVGNDDTAKNTPLLLRQIINGRLLGGSGKKDGRLDRSMTNTSDNTNIIQRCNNMHQPNTSRMPPLPLSSATEMRHHPGYRNTVLSRLTSWLPFPLIYAEDDCDHDYGYLHGKNTTSGLKFLPSRSIEIDSDENDDDDDDYSSASSVDYDPCGESSVPEGVTPEMEREFSTEANLSVSEIAEAYYAHQLLDERRRRSNSDATTSSQQSGLSSSALHHTTDFNYTEEEDTGQRLDYEITQMDIARMARNASRHLDVDSILNLPTIVYRKRRSPHHVCAPIHEDRNDLSAQGSTLIIKGTESDTSILSEDGWSFMMVSDMKPSVVDNSVEKSSNSSFYLDEDNKATATTATTDDMCVICLEHFRDGDRLRVLPCDHSFHVGCIDRWLSGTHSHNECFTAGCPTCKKRPSIRSPLPSSSLEVSTLDVTETAERDMSGSVPSWAFTNLGSVMAMSSDNFLD